MEKVTSKIQLIITQKTRINLKPPQKMEPLKANIPKKLINLLQKLHITTLIIATKETIRNKIKTSTHRSRLTLITHTKVSLTQIINDVITLQKERRRKVNTIETIAIIERTISRKIPSEYRAEVLQLCQSGKR